LNKQFRSPEGTAEILGCQAIAMKTFLVGTSKYMSATHWSAGMISVFCWSCLMLNMNTGGEAIAVATGLAVGVVSAFHFANWEKSGMKWIGWINFSMYSVVIIGLLYLHIL
jgi:hypothetical protein